MAKKSKHVEEGEENSADQTMETDSPTKIKKEKDDDKQSYEELLNHVSVIANPMASRKLTKKVYKLLKKGDSLSSTNKLKPHRNSNNLFLIQAAKQKGYVRNGLKDVQRRIRLGENG